MQTIARLLPLLLALSGLGRAQELRSAIDAAPVVVVGRHRGVRLHGDDFVLHRVQVAQALRGTPGETVTVVEWKKLSDHNRPAVAATHLYCLHPVADPQRLGLPPGDCYRMDGHAGSHPPVDERAPASGEDPVVALARVLLAADRLSVVEQKGRLLELALQAPAPAGSEAAHLLAERPTLRDALDAVDLAGILTRAGAETADIDRKLALATICAERRVEGLIDALGLTWHRLDDERLSRAIGRFALHLHGEQATEVLQGWLQRARTPQARGHVLLALGATGTESALEALLRLRKLDPDNRYVAAALRLHGAPRAVEAVERRR